MPAARRRGAIALVLLAFAGLAAGMPAAAESIYLRYDASDAQAGYAAAQMSHAARPRLTNSGARGRRDRVARALAPGA